MEAGQRRQSHCLHPHDGTTKGASARDVHPPTQPDYGAVTFASSSFDAHIKRIDRAAVPALDAAAAALAVMAPWFGGKPLQTFEKPSNPVFQPPEYELTNCCMACPFVSLCGQFCTSYFGTTDDFNCNCQLLQYCSTGYMGWGISCDPQAPDTVAKARNTLIAALAPLPRKNYAEGRVVSCPIPTAISWAGNSASDKANCVSLPIDATTIYAGSYACSVRQERYRFVGLLQ